MFILLYFLLLIFFIGTIVFVRNLKHLLLILLSLEFMVLSLFIYLIIFLGFFCFEQYFRIFFLVYSVCEGALGLSILVILIRTHGNDYFQTFSILKC